MDYRDMYICVRDIFYLARYYGVECETALSSSTEKFISRFLQVEELIQSEGKTFSELTPEQVDGYYNEIKKR